MQSLRKGLGFYRLCLRLSRVRPIFLIFLIGQFLEKSIHWNDFGRATVRRVRYKSIQLESAFTMK